MSRALPLLFALYFCQGLPGGFLAKALPAILRQEGLSLTAVGFAGALSLPWMLKILWAPLVDRFGSATFGRRKSWLVPAQLGMLIVTVAFIGIDPRDSLVLVAALFLLLNVCSATQDIAVDGLAVDVLRDEQLAPGNAAQVSGFKLGNIVGGGVLLSVMAWLGWSGVFSVMALLLSGVIVAVLLFAEPPSPRTEVTLGGVLRSLFTAIGRQGAWFWLFLVFAKFGETFGGAMVTPMLVDQGFSLPLIGGIEGTVGGLATIGGAAVGGAVAWREGWRRLLVGAAALQGAALVSLGIYSQFTVTPLGYAVVGGIENAAGGAVAVGIFHLAMSWRDDEAGAAHFTAAQAVYMVGSMIAYPLSGAAAEQWGYMPVMAVGGAMAIGLAALCLGPAARLEAPPRDAAEPPSGSRGSGTKPAGL